MSLHRIAAWAGLLSILSGTAAPAGVFKQILIDGSFDDWIGVPVAYEDPADSETSADYRRIWLANDSDYFYLRFSLERPANPFTANSNIFIDSDADPGTGFGIIVGSEMLIQSGVGYSERNGGFNDGPLNGLDWLAAPEGSATEFEARVSRHTTFGDDDSPVFSFDLIALLLEAEDSNFTRQETAPDSEGLYYEFAAPPPPLTGASVLIPLAATWRWNSSGNNPGDAWRFPDFDDSQAGWSSGGALLGYTETPGAFPAAIATPLPSGPATHYFRTRFDWNHDSAGVVFVVTNYVSDGAALYLNGAEVRRIRLPSGELQPSTPATGGPPASGQPELFALSPGPLVQGENVLAVETHQSPSTPQDMVFGLSLVAATEFPVVLPDPTQPADRSVVGGESTTWSVEVIGSAPLTYQWSRNGEPIAGATGPNLVLETVLPSDAGTYSVRVSNPLTQAGVTSREALLTVVSTPVEILQQPVSITVSQGRSASFTVSASGSAPLSYQWYKGAAPIEGATQSTLDLPSVALEDAGEYSVEVSNPAPSSARSAPARLTVLQDQSPPVLISVAGSPNQVLLTFSEPLDGPASLASAAFLFTGGLQADHAEWNEASPNVMAVVTSAQQLGTRYDITISGVADAFGNALPGTLRRAFVSTIQIDGSFEDWGGLTPVVEDPADAENATDYAQAWVFNDADYLYLRVKLHTPSDFGIFYNNLFFNTDGDSTSGFAFRALGSEMLIQGGGGYDQRTGGFNEGTVDGLDWFMMPEGVADEFEVRLSRRATFAKDGLPVFSAEAISFFLESENTGFVTVDVAPDLEPITHTWTEVPVADLGNLLVSRTANGVTLEWSSAGRLQSVEPLVGGAWQDVPAAASPYVVTPTAGALFYRLAQ